MSQNYYFKNIDDNEYIHASGNGNFSDSLYGDNPKFITWVLLRKWLGKKVICVVEHEMPGGYGFISQAHNRTDKFREEFAKREESTGEETYKAARRLAREFLKSDLTKYGLNYDDGTLEGLDITINKPNKHSHNSGDKTNG